MKTETTKSSCYSCITQTMKKCCTGIFKALPILLVKLAKITTFFFFFMQKLCKVTINLMQRKIFSPSKEEKEDKKVYSPEEERIREAEALWEKHRYDISSALRHLAIKMPEIQVETLEDLFCYFTESNIKSDIFNDPVLKQNILEACYASSKDAELLFNFKENCSFLKVLEELTKIVVQRFEEEVLEVPVYSNPLQELFYLSRQWDHIQYDVNMTSLYTEIYFTKIIKAINEAVKKRTSFHE